MRGQKGTHLMRTPRERGASQQMDLYPQLQACPVCHQVMKERYHKRRWIVRLDQPVKVVSHFLECVNTACMRQALVYRPQQEDALALRGYTFGLDVVARIGELRYRNNLSIIKIREQLQTESHLSISRKEVALLCEVFLALVTTVARQDEELIAQLKALDGIVLAIDGVQPEKSHETLYILRDVRSGRVLVAKTLLSSATVEIEPLIEEVLSLGLPILGVISDKQESREIERQVEDMPSKEAQLVADYCLAVRTVMRDDGQYPLEPAGLKLYQKLQLIVASVERVMGAHPSALLKKLLRMLAVLHLFQQEFEQLVILFSWSHHIAHLVKDETSRAQVQSRLLTFVHHLQQSCSHDGLLSLVAYVEKITIAFTPHLFDYLKQPLLPRTNNDLELFIGRIKKSRRHITGRKNTQEFILREGSFIAILFGLPGTTHWVDTFPSVHLNDFHHTLNLLRQPEKRSKCWHARHDLAAYLASLEPH